MASSHRVTDLEKIPVRISKDEAPTAIVSSWAVVYFLLVISSFSNLVRCVAFRSFSFSLLQLSQQARPHQGACLLLGVLFSQFILVCFIICKNEKVLFALVQQTSDFVASLGLGLGQLPVLPIHCFFSWLNCLFVYRVISFIYDVRVSRVVSMLNETSHSFFVWSSS